LGADVQFKYKILSLATSKTKFTRTLDDGRQMAYYGHFRV
jgi:hypothetical protein